MCPSATTCLVLTILQSITHSSHAKRKISILGICRGRPIGTSQSAVCLCCLTGYRSTTAADFNITVPMRRQINSTGSTLDPPVPRSKTSFASFHLVRYRLIQAASNNDRRANNDHMAFKRLSDPRSVRNPRVIARPRRTLSYSLSWRTYILYLCRGVSQPRESKETSSAG